MQIKSFINSICLHSKFSPPSLTTYPQLFLLGIVLLFAAERKSAQLSTLYFPGFLEGRVEASSDQWIAGDNV
jgi:hypothetical protein